MPGEASPAPSPTLAQLGEDGVVAAVLARFGRPDPARLPVGPGDDAAVLALGNQQIVLSTDTLVEGRDFRLTTADGADVGVKSAAQNLADVAAMGARPLALLVSLAAPGDLPVAWVEQFAAGIARECARAGAVVAGGDISESTEVVITGTAVGALDGRPPVLRHGARPGDVVALAGVSGHSAAGLTVLEAGLGHLAADDPAVRDVVAAHRRPCPPYPAGVLAATAGAHAMIDTSDGLVRDARRLAAASTVVIDLDSGALRPEPLLRAAAARVGADALTWVLGGGEDHALLACFAPEASLPSPFRQIGTVLAGEPDVQLDGRPWKGAGGWTHFGR